MYTDHLQDPGEIDRKYLMILGEGLVFLLIIIAGIWRIRRSVKKDLLANHRQKNFLLSVTHELKTPLASNRLLLQTALRSGLNEDRRNDLLQKAIEDNLRLENLIENILHSTQIDHQNVLYHPEEVNLTQMLETLTQRYQRYASDRNWLIEAGDAVTAMGDPRLIETILSNLIDNAIKYSPAHSTITLKCTEDRTSVYIAVSDEGKGIPLPEQQSVFERFVRVGDEATRQSSGSGLGLYISKEFAKINKSLLKIDKTGPEGTTFSLSIPKQL